MLKQLALVSGDPSKDTSLEKEDVQDLNPRGRGLHSLENKWDSCQYYLASERKEAFAWNRRKIPVEISSSEYLREALLDAATLLNPVNLSIPGFAEDASEAVGAIFFKLILEGHPPVRYIPGPKEKWVGIDPPRQNSLCIFDVCFLDPVISRKFER